MRETTMIRHRLHRCACAVAACLGIAVSGCTDDSSSQSAAPAAVVTRTQDPEYNARLKAANDEQKSLMSELADAREAYEAAKAEDPECERTKELEARVAACDARLKEQRERTVKMVRGRIWKEFEEAEKGGK